MFDRIRLQRRYPHPPQKVWVAITDRVALAEWLMPNDFAPVVGHRFTFQVDPFKSYSGITDCEVLEVDPPRRLVYSWTPRAIAAPGKSPQPSTVTWTLEPHADGTILTLEHDGLTAAYPFWLFRFMLRFGWGTMVKRWIPAVAGKVAADGSYAPGVLGSTRWRYSAKTVPDTHTKLP